MTESLLIASPPGSGNQYWQKLLKVYGVQTRIVHAPSHLGSNVHTGRYDKALVPTRDWGCSESSMDPGRDNPRTNDIKLLRTFGPTRRMLYEKLMAALVQNGWDWRFVTYESLAVHPEHTLTWILQFAGMQAGEARALAHDKQLWQEAKFVFGNQKWAEETAQKTNPS